MKNDNHVWDNKLPTAQMLGRWQPWHEGHQKLFEEILKKTGQVNIMVRDVKGVGDNPFDFETVKKNIFEALKDYKNLELKKYEDLLKSNGIEIAGIEYIKGNDGKHYTYDINTNTNYNSIAERKSNLKGMDSIASFLYNELRK